MNIAELEFNHPEIMQKISNSHNLKGRVRKVTDREADLIQKLDTWRNGYFMHGSAQICLNKRENGQYVIYRIN